MAISSIDKTIELDVFVRQDGSSLFAQVLGKLRLNVKESGPVYWSNADTEALLHLS